MHCNINIGINFLIRSGSYYAAKLQDIDTRRDWLRLHNQDWSPTEIPLRGSVKATLPPGDYDVSKKGCHFCQYIPKTYKCSHIRSLSAFFIVVIRRYMTQVLLSFSVNLAGRDSGRSFKYEKSSPSCNIKTQER